MNKHNRELFEYEKVVMDELLSYGYPEESIVLEGKLDARRYVDFIVVDISTGLPLMMIELKACSERTYTSIRQLAFSALKNNYEKCSSPIKAIAAIMDKEVGTLEFIDFTEAIKDNNFERAINDYKLPSYEILTIGARQKAITKQKEEQKKKIAALKWLCWGVFPLIFLSLILLDYFDIYNLSTLRLTAIGVGAAVTLIPCFKEIKIGEITLKNIIEKEDSK